MLSCIKRNQVLAFSVLAYSYSWIIWAPLVLSSRGIIDLAVPAWIHLTGSWGPLLAAFSITALTSGSKGMREIMSRLFRWKTGFKWIVVAFSPVILFTIALAVDGLISGTEFDLSIFGRLSEAPGIAGIFGWGIMLATFGIGEETGWRGFALPRLQNSHSAFKATLILTAIWLGWHLPMFAYKESFIAMGFGGTAGWAISLAFGAVVLTWLYNSARGSILMVAIWHATFNAAVTAGEGSVSMIVSLLVIIWGVVILRHANKENLSASSKQVLTDGCVKRRALNEYIEHDGSQ